MRKRNKSQIRTYTAFFAASSTGPRKIDPGPTFIPKTENQINTQIQRQQTYQATH